MTKFSKIDYNNWQFHKRIFEMHCFKWILTLLPLFFCPISFALDNDNKPIIVFVAKKIITMDPSWPDATAIAVKEGKILSVGSLQDLQPWLNKNSYQIDKTFANKIMMPGFVEAHAHPLIGGTAMTRPLLTFFPVPNPYGPAFPGIKTKSEALAKLSQYVKQTPPSETLVAWGYDTIAFGGELDSKDLDKISSTQPIIVWDASEHLVYANTAAMKKYHITPADTKINGIMADANGNPNGQFIGVTAATFILPKALAELLTPEAAYKNIKFLMDLSRKNGITTTSEMTFGLINLPFEQLVYDKYYNDPATPMRIVVVSDATSMEKAKGNEAIHFVKQLENQSTDKLIFNGIKFFSDDAFVSLTMVINHPGYIDQHQGAFITPPDQMFAKWSPWWDAGFHIHVHSNGNGGNEATINAIYQLMQNKPRFDHRFTIEHYGISTPEMAREIKSLGAIVSVNPNYLYDRVEINEPLFGTDRADTAARFKTLVDNHIPTSMHSDTPVAPPNPLQEVWIAVNRFGVSGKVHGPAERISVDQALRMITIDAAYTLGEEDKIGSISPGKFADFVILEQDPYSVSKDKIRNIAIWGTVHNGKKYPASDIRP